MVKKIKITKNGPYKVTGGIPLSQQKIIMDADGFPSEWTKEEKIPTEENYLLCRCGKSRNKPFCDNSHLAGFDGQETAEVEGYHRRAKKFQGQNLTLKDDPTLCVHAGFCDRAGSVWELIKKNDQVSIDTLKEEVSNCPSGRLTLEEKNRESIEPDLDQSISLIHDPATDKEGAIWVKGGVEVESADGETYEKRNRVTLCKCGKSKNKPFCDGSHMS